MNATTHEEENEKLYYLFEAADQEWSSVLVKAFGKRQAGDARYTPIGRGEPIDTRGNPYLLRAAKYSAELKAAYEKRSAACEAAYEHGRKKGIF